MNQRKLQSAALFFTILSGLLIVPPLVLLFNHRVRFLGLPVEMIYLFVAWLIMVLVTRWLSSRLPHEPGLEKPEGLE